MHNSNSESSLHRTCLWSIQEWLLLLPIPLILQYLVRSPDLDEEVPSYGRDGGGHGGVAGQPEHLLLAGREVS